MIKIFVDSGSSIKQEEKEKYNVEILPLKIRLGLNEYTDGIDLSNEVFYDALINKKIFPKTSLPSLGEVKERVEKSLEEGNDVIILTISSAISGTYNSIRMLFSENDRVRVIDTKSAVGGIRLLVNEINKYRDMPLDFISDKVNALIPKIRVVAVPETLDYLMMGGRLSKSAWALGSVLQLKPLISLDSSDGNVKVLGKAMGKRRAMEAVAQSLVTMNCDSEHEIIASYTYNRENLETLIGLTDKKYHGQIKVYDDLDSALACHWGPNAYGYIFISKE